MDGMVSRDTRFHLLARRESLPERNPAVNHDIGQSSIEWIAVKGPPGVNNLVTAEIGVPASCRQMNSAGAETILAHRKIIDRHYLK